MNKCKVDSSSYILQIAAEIIVMCRLLSNVTGSLHCMYGEKYWTIIIIFEQKMWKLCGQKSPWKSAGIALNCM